jgi:hypothetical protein
MILITQAEYARRRQVAPSAVTRAVMDGRIRLHGGLVDPDEADRDWDASTDPIAQASTAALQRRNRAGAAPPSDPAPLPGADDSEGPAGGTAEPSAHQQLMAARADREKLQAELSRLELARKRGELVSVSEVERHLSVRAISMRESLDAIADRLATVLAAETDPDAIHRLIRAELHAALEQLTEPGLSRGPTR